MHFGKKDIRHSALDNTSEFIYISVFSFRQLWWFWTEKQAQVL